MKNKCKDYGVHHGQGYCSTQNIPCLLKKYGYKQIPKFISYVSQIRAKIYHRCDGQLEHLIEEDVTGGKK